MRKAVSYILLVVYVMLLTLPYYGYIHFYIYKSFFRKNEITVSASSSAMVNPGDISYLKAIQKRAVGDSQSEEPDTPPPPNMDTGNLVYLGNEIAYQYHIPHDLTFQFKKYTISIKETFMEVPVPPPEPA